MTITMRSQKDDYLIAMLDKGWISCDELAALMKRSKNQCYAILSKQGRAGNVAKTTKESLQVVYKLTKAGEERARRFATPQNRTCPHCGGVL